MAKLINSRLSSLRGPLAALTLLMVMTVAVADYPSPNRAGVRWELDFEPGPLRLFVDDQGDTYWYFTYMVTNTTGDDQVWAPILTLFTDDGAIMKSGQGVSSRVDRKLHALLGNEYLQSQNQIIGDILQGEEHALEGLVVWPANNMEVTELSLFIAGLSGETAEIQHPTTGDRVVFQKTLQRNYVIPGDPLPRGDDPLEFESNRWIMR